MPRIPHILPCLLVLALGLPAGEAAAASATDLTGYDAGPGIITPPTPRAPVQLPPQLPKYLPNGAVNLDEAWIEDGGARLYWNTLLIPRQLKMAGATWIDPALVPPLFAPPQPKQPRKRWRAPRKAAPKQAVTTVKVPEGVGSTALICVPAAPGIIPLPLTATEPVAATPVAPKAATTAPPAEPAEPARAAAATPPAPAAPKVPGAQAPTEPVPAPPLQ